ncbi:glutathione reductase (NADPH) [Methanohalophilus levihalophilus]|uniref:dihydrolipoyl dehydrogenase family protein n=1 Tax=Methanohalophilus levihalophilus TaxID=1431282 RepID=UPI001AE42028|nr:NAD(P)/FAD-dependent oxidoreductase [Methanohalophilus levihalophilus]MBP2030280.1 glutathione reductase (NADPH) [Methanohalophilus levihalophilus]
MEAEYDVIVIGTGVAGPVCANKLARYDMKVAIVDSREYGGTCALRGCVPKKVLVGVAELVERTEKFHAVGAVDCAASINWKKLIELKETFVDFQPAQKEAEYGQKGIDTYHGQARFLSPDTITIGDKQLKAKYIFIATGGIPKPLEFKGHEHLVTSEDFLELETLPKRILFAGGGYISFEFAHVAARAGAEVTILQRGKHILKHFDSDMTDLLTKASEEAGIKIHTEHVVIAVDKVGNEYVVTAATPAGEETFICDLVVHGSGRIPALEGMDLEKGNVELENGGIAVNEFMQSVSNPKVYAGGDCVKIGAPLTPIASLQGTVAASNILSGNTKTVDYNGVPSAVFTIPTLASVGISLEKADEKYDVYFHDTSDWYTSRRLQENISATKVIVEKETGKIAGAHLLGSEAAEVINIFAMAMRLGITLDEFKKVVYVFPTMASDIQHMIRK